MKLSDEVPFRYHWPKNCSLRVNNTQYRVYGRSPTNKLGPNQRDEPAIIGELSPYQEGLESCFKRTITASTFQCMDPFSCTAGLCWFVHC